MHSLEWVTPPDTINKILEDSQVVFGATTIGATFTGTLNMSCAANPLAGDQYGELTIVNEEPWTPQPQYTDGTFPFPPPALIHASRLVLVQFNRNDDAHPVHFCSDMSFTFGSPGNLAFLEQQDSYSVAAGDEQRNCWAVARLNFTAGVAKCINCPVVSDSVVEAVASPSQPLTTLPHPLVQDAISMIPETLSYMAINNISQMPTWENLDGYTRGMLSIAYQASWNSMMNEFQTNTPEYTTVNPALPVLLAHVTRWRMLTWAGLNALLTLSGILLAILQSSCSAKTVRNPALAALLLDTKAITDDDVEGFCNAVRLNKHDVRRRVKLIVSSETNSSYRHLRLVPYLDEDVYLPLHDLDGKNESVGISAEALDGR